MRAVSGKLFWQRGEGFYERAVALSVEFFCIMIWGFDDVGFEM